MVYKNKDDGSRAIRYRGKDEAYAVNELYLKLKSEVTLRRTTDMRSTPQPTGSSFTRPSPVRKTARRMGCVYILIIFITMLMLQSTFLGMRNRVRAPLRGYYSYQDENYFYNSGSWYSYNDLTGSWDDTTAADELIDHSDRYWRSNRPDPGLNPHPEQSTAVSDTSSSYESSSSWEDDWDDSDWDYDYSSWDSSDTDWSSDW